MSLSGVIKKIQANNRSNSSPSPHRSRRPSSNTRSTNAPAVVQQPSTQRKQSSNSSHININGSNHNQSFRTSSANHIISNQEDGLRIGSVNPSLIQLPALDQSDQISDYNTQRSKYNQVVGMLVDLVQQGNNYIPSSGNDEYSSFSNHNNNNTAHIPISNLSCNHCKRPFSTLENRQNYKAGGVPDQIGMSFGRQPITMINIDNDNERSSNLSEPAAGNLPQEMDVGKQPKFKDILMKNLPPEAIEEKMEAEERIDGPWETVKSRREKKRTMEKAQVSNSQRHGNGRNKYKSIHQNKHMKN